MYLILAEPGMGAPGSDDWCTPRQAPSRLYPGGINVALVQIRE